MKYRLKGNESFMIREGWLSKGLEAVSNNHFVFKENFGADALGVGSNMAKSIRYWLKACSLTKEGGKGVELTELGEQIFLHDKYLEDLFTIWLLHYNLAVNFDNATVWNLFFHWNLGAEFNKEEVYIYLLNQLERILPGTEFSMKSLENDCSVLLSMYTKGKSEKEPEENNISPFSALGLLKKSGQKYQKMVPDPSILDKSIVWYAITKQCTDKNSISIREILEGKDSPGLLFQLNRVLISSYLDALEKEGLLKVNRTAGLDVVYINSVMPELDIIDGYYRNRKID